MYIKYFDLSHSATGTFYLIEKQATTGMPQQPLKRGYPIRKVLGNETRRQRRVKQLFLPMTGSIRIYSGGASIEFGSTLEFG